MEVLGALQPLPAVIVGSEQAVAADMLEGSWWDLFEAAFQLGGRQVEGVVVDFAAAVVESVQKDSDFAEISRRVQVLALARATPTAPVEDGPLGHHLTPILTEGGILPAAQFDHHRVRPNSLRHRLPVFCEHCHLGLRKVILVAVRDRFE